MSDCNMQYTAIRNLVIIDKSHNKWLWVQDQENVGICAQQILRPVCTSALSNLLLLWLVKDPIAATFATHSHQTVVVQAGLSMHFLVAQANLYHFMCMYYHTDFCIRNCSCSLLDLLSPCWRQRGIWKRFTSICLSVHSSIYNIYVRSLTPKVIKGLSWNFI